MGSQPDHHEVLTTLVDLCTNAITECEAQLEQQKALDMAEAKRLEEEQKASENEARILAEQQEKERRENMEQMEKERLEIEAAERDLAARKAKVALRNVQKGPDDDEQDEEEEGEEEGSESGVEEHPVSLAHNISTISYTYSKQQLYQDTPKAKTKRELDEEARKKADQTTHSNVSVPLQIRIMYSRTFDSSVPTAPGLTKLLVRVQPDKHVIFAGSRRGAAATVVSNHPSDCSYTLLMSVFPFSGRRRPTIKKEPKSPVQPSRKRKAYSTTGANSIGRIEILESDIDIAPPSGKRHKSSSGTSQVRFDGVMVPPVPPAPPARATRKSARTAKANEKKDMRELFERLGQELGAAAKTCEEMSELCD